MTITPASMYHCYLGGLDRAAILSELSGFGFRSVSESRISPKHESLDHLPWARVLGVSFFGTLESFFFISEKFLQLNWFRLRMYHPNPNKKALVVPGRLWKSTFLISKMGSWKGLDVLRRRIWKQNWHLIQRYLASCSVKVTAFPPLIEWVNVFTFIRTCDFPTLPSL